MAFQQGPTPPPAPATTEPRAAGRSRSARRSSMVGECKRQLSRLMARRPWLNAEYWRASRKSICCWLRCLYGDRCLRDFSESIREFKMRYDVEPCFRIPKTPILIDEPPIKRGLHVVTHPVLLNGESVQTLQTLRSFLYRDQGASVLLGTFVFTAASDVRGSDDCPLIGTCRWTENGSPVELAQVANVSRAVSRVSRVSRVEAAPFLGNGGWPRMVDDYWVGAGKRIKTWPIGDRNRQEEFFLAMSNLPAANSYQASAVECVKNNFKQMIDANQALTDALAARDRQIADLQTQLKAKPAVVAPPPAPLEPAKKMLPPLINPVDLSNCQKENADLKKAVEAARSDAAKAVDAAKSDAAKTIQAAKTDADNARKEAADAKRLLTDKNGAASTCQANLANTQKTLDKANLDLAKAAADIAALKQTTTADTRAVECAETQNKKFRDTLNALKKQIADAEAAAGSCDPQGPGSVKKQLSSGPNTQFRAQPNGGALLPPQPLIRRTGGASIVHAPHQQNQQNHNIMYRPANKTRHHSHSPQMPLVPQMPQFRPSLRMAGAGAAAASVGQYYQSPAFDTLEAIHFPVRFPSQQS